MSVEQGSNPEKQNSLDITEAYLNMSPTEFRVFLSQKNQEPSLVIAVNFDSVDQPVMFDFLRDVPDKQGRKIIVRGSSDERQLFREVDPQLVDVVEWQEISTDKKSFIKNKKVFNS
ncbi:MAG: hypothetical protein Q8P83_04185 [bacterium]|nr:hypothetical protein [bacterium]